jgi:ligand-binding sensor domain-containing protein/signal transduction histidine kinase
MYWRSFQLTVVVWLALAGQGQAAAGVDAHPGSRGAVSRRQWVPFSVRAWTTEDGLPQNRIQCLTQTQDGYLWIGTWAGLARFDGVHFTVFNKFTTPALAGHGGDAISALVQDTDGTLWIGTGNGLVSYRNHRFRKWTTADGLPRCDVWDLARFRSGGVWVHAGDSVVRFRNGRFSRACKPGPRGRILSMRERGDGGLDVVTDCGWFTVSPDALEVRTNLVVPPAQSWLSAFRAKKGGFWVGTSQGVCYATKVNGQAAETNEPGGHPVPFIYQDRSGTVWAGIERAGLYRRVHGKWQLLDLGPGFRGVSPICMTDDIEGNLWIGTDNGLVRLVPKRVRAFTAEDGLADDSALSVCEGTDGAIWVGTEHGLSRIRDERVMSFHASEPYPDYRDCCVWPNRTGGVWFGKSGQGIYEVENGKFYRRAEGHGLLAPFGMLYGDREGRLWLGRAGKALAFREDPFGVDKGTANLPVRDVGAALEDRRRDLWFGMRGPALVRLHRGKVSVFTEPGGFTNNAVWSIDEDVDGTLWLGTENGLRRFRNGEFFAFRRSQGLAENTVNCVLEDDFGNLWLSGLHGIYRVSRAQLNAVADGRAGKVQCIGFDTSDGMETPETNGGENQPAGWKAHDGRLWFPTARGVVVIDPKRIRDEEALLSRPPPVVIEQVEADDKVVYGDGWLARGRARIERSQARVEKDAPAGPIRIRPGTGHFIEFRYTANSFVAPGKVRFRYRLVNYEADWSEETDERSAHYANLPPGRYQFEVTAENHRHLWNPRPAVLAFVIQPRFTQTWTFYVLCAGLLIGLGAGVQAYRLRWQRRFLRLAHQEALASERTRIARDLHDDLGTALTGLALELDVIRSDGRGGAQSAQRLAEAASRTRSLAERMREVVWAVNPRCDTVSSLATFLEQQAGQLLGSTAIRSRVEFPDDIPPVPLDGEARHQLALGVREALTNVIRHSQASEVALRLGIEGMSLVVRVADNGVGCPMTCLANDVHGLANLQARMRRMGGSFECMSRPGRGTTITFRVPIPGFGRQNQEDTKA